MPASLWSDPGTWIALGISALFLVAAWVLHRVFVRVLKSAPPETPGALSTATPSPPDVRADATSDNSQHDRHS